MSTSMYSGVSGLRSQQTRLDVIGNNIANINTIGYKGQRVNFSDLLCQTISGASGPNAATNQGGTNPEQVGLGVGVAAVDTNMGTGSTQSTGIGTDLSIGGAGFFIIQGRGSGDYKFTRAGNFGVDKSGNLNIGGELVCGWENYGGAAQADGTYAFKTQESVQPINIYKDGPNGNKRIIAPKATANAALAGNLNPALTDKGTGYNTIGTVPATPDATATMTAYDNMGNAYNVQVNLYKCKVDTTDAANPKTSWYWQLASSATNLNVNPTTNNGYLDFDKDGKIIPGAANTPSVTLTPTGTTAGAAPFDVKLDFTGLSNYVSSGGYSVSPTSVDGYKAGDLSDISIGSDGMIMGIYNNGQKQPLGMIALANFDNPGGLEKSGSNMYVTTANSGNFTAGLIAGTGGTGKLTPGVLEGSNVDMAGEFSNMMMTQRAYQANSKIITVSDQMMQTLTDMVRG